MRRFRDEVRGALNRKISLRRNRPQVRDIKLSAKWQATFTHNRSRSTARCISEYVASVPHGKITRKIAGNFKTASSSAKTVKQVGVNRLHFRICRKIPRFHSRIKKQHRDGICRMQLNPNIKPRDRYHASKIYKKNGWILYPSAIPLLPRNGKLAISNYSNTSLNSLSASRFHDNP